MFWFFRSVIIIIRDKSPDQRKTELTSFAHRSQEDGPLYKFNEAIMDSGDVFMNTINNLKDVTLFAPSNQAWMDANLQNVIRYGDGRLAASSGF